MHEFHDGRYNGADILPQVDRPHEPAAALVLVHPKKRVALSALYAALDAHPQQQPVVDVRLVPITVVDFYSKRKK